jgi:hypothetical protein
MKPFAWYLRTGHGDAIHFGTEPPQCAMRDAWKPLYGGAVVDELIEAAKKVEADLENATSIMTRKPGMPDRMWLQERCNCLRVALAATGDA